MRQRVHKPPTGDGVSLSLRMSLSLSLSLSCRGSAQTSPIAFPLLCCGNFENTLLIEFMPRRQVDNFRRQLATVGNVLMQQQQKNPPFPLPCLPHPVCPLSIWQQGVNTFAAVRLKIFFMCPAKREQKTSIRRIVCAFSFFAPPLLLLLQLRLRQAFARALSACHDNLNACCVLRAGALKGGEDRGRRLAAATGK